MAVERFEAQYDLNDRRAISKVDEINSLLSRAEARIKRDERRVERIRRRSSAQFRERPPGAPDTSTFGNAAIREIKRTAITQGVIELTSTLVDSAGLNENAFTGLVTSVVGQVGAALAIGGPQGPVLAGIAAISQVVTVISGQMKENRRRIRQADLDIAELKRVQIETIIKFNQESERVEQKRKETQGELREESFQKARELTIQQWENN